MVSQRPNNVAKDSQPPSGNRRYNIALFVVLGFVALAMWQTGRGGGCFSGACLIPDFVRTDSPAREKPAALTARGAEDTEIRDRE